ncbi:MAG: hypothetical protein IT168_13930 [Bryobacterales bacterium]|nr:hypothetical protein [Bryobacterales bacterium]
MKRFGVLLLAARMIGGAAELPVRNIILYKHGVGYFERFGELSAGESARLDFKEEDMNDVLKSLTVEVKGGAGVAALRYDSAEPLERKLEQFPVKIGAGQPISALLDQMRGAQLELTLSGTQTVQGVIVSARVVKGSENQPEREAVVLLLGSDEIKTFDLGAVSSIRFLDPKLQLQLKEYLATLTQARSKDRRSVYIDSSDAGRRQIAASYITPTPVWKSSYRLLFPATGDALLEGWAIVDNTTGEDWTNIRLALVSGRPISFISRLYEPKYVERQVAELPEDRAQAPVVHGGVVGGIIGSVAAAAPLPPPAPKAEERPFERPQQFARLQKAPSISFDRGQTESTFAQTSQGRELGELFEYRFSQPITVKKNESAMLPFLQQKLPARKLLIYADESSQHPLNAAEITNSSGKTLDGGPITVYDSGAYAGEALFETVKTGDKRLISYGIDIGTRITTKFDSKSGVIREASFNRGYLTTRSAVRETKTYTARNVDQKAKTLIIEHPVRFGYTLLNPKPLETTAKAYRFEVKLAAGGAQTFAIEEERILSQNYSITNMTPDLIASFIGTSGLPAPARQGLQQILDKKREVAQVDNELRRTEQEIQELVQDQSRIRENMTSLSRVAGQQEQAQKYANQLSAQESKLAQMRDRQAELRRKKAAAESDLNALLERLTF